MQAGFESFIFQAMHGYETNLRKYFFKNKFETIRHFTHERICCMYEVSSLSIAKVNITDIVVVVYTVKCCTCIAFL